MAAFASLESLSGAGPHQPVQVGVYRYQPGGGSAFEYLPNIRVTQIQFREGADAGTARFAYIFDDRSPSTIPRSFQDVMSVDSSLPGVVGNDERLVVMSRNPDASRQILFDGFAQVPELELSSSREKVTFLAYGVAIREWDQPIGGALVRDSADPTSTLDQSTDLLTHFNPQGYPNATPASADATNASGETHPTFLDPLIVRSPDVRRHWTLPMAARYLCYHHNSNETYVANPSGDRLDAILDSRSPQSGSYFVPDDPTTSNDQAITIPDYPATGRAWPTVLQDLLKPQGFGMTFRLETDSSGAPRTRLEVFRQQDGSTAPSKPLLLQPRGSRLDPAACNVGEARLARDTSRVANAYSVESGLVRFEASFILAPGFAISAADAQTATALAQFDRNSASFSLTNQDKYRLYVFDETGEGHWDWNSSSLSRSIASLAPLWVQDPQYRGQFARRRRVPIDQLFSLDANRKPLRAQLSVSTNYAGTQPGLWDGSGNWQPVGSGFELLRDRLGIWINAPNPNAWNIQGSKIAGSPYPAGVVRGVEDQVAGGSRRFTLRLTCVVEADQVAAATADRRPSSPVSYTITRRVDARDRYARNWVAASSEFRSDASPLLIRDDGPDALAEAMARRLASEAGEVVGSVTIPRFTQAYRIGDRITAIQGRELSLQTNAGAPNEEGQVYPTVVGLTWDFEGRQQTILQLSDHKGA